MHEKNKHNGQYDFDKLISNYPALEKYVSKNKYGTLTIDFFNSQAVKALNKALLISYYNIEFWDIPENNLCPPIPGRADYIHHVADLIENKYEAKCLDVGVGANCIYPIIGHAEYGWKFIATDISITAINNATEIVNNNHSLKNNVELRLQENSKNIFKGVVSKHEYFDVSICNPPFHSSQEEAQHGTLRKLSNLKGKKITETSLNFGGIDNELWCDGGEIKFIINMINESCDYKNNFGWFTVLVSKEENLNRLYAKLINVEVQEYRTINMQHGNKISRIVAWHF